MPGLISNQFGSYGSTGRGFKRGHLAKTQKFWPAGSGTETFLAGDPYWGPYGQSSEG